MNIIGGTLICLAVIMPVASARAEGVRWFALAESADPDEAIWIALAHRWWFDAVAVAAAENGRYVTIAGPLALEENDADALSGLLGSGDWPAGIEVVEATAIGPVVWSLPDSTVTRHEYWHSDGGHVFTDHFSIELSAQFDLSDETLKPVLTLVEDGHIVLETTTDESGTSCAFARIRIAWLNRAAPVPQIALSAYTMGAHCCTVTRVLTRDAGGWIEVEGGWHDGDEGYRIEDIDGNGEFELIARDDRFLNRFAPYATSWTPIRIFKLTDGALVDVSNDAAYASAHRREVHAFEHHAELDPELWHEAGFLAGWMALKIALGEREEAWPRMLEAYDDDGFWNHTTCEADFVKGACPDRHSRSASFPEALEDYLERGNLEKR